MDEKPFSTTEGEDDDEPVPAPAPEFLGDHSITGPPSSLDVDVDHNRARMTSLDEDSSSPSMLPPLAPERTLKEKLVERERQKRIETERARLKRQFALSNGGVLESIEDNKEDGSVVGTVGDGSSVAAAAVGDDQDESKADNKLGYAMERFLSEQGAVVKDAKKPPAALKDDGGGVVMERFLSEPVVVAPVVDVDGEDSASAEDDPPPDPPAAASSVTFGNTDVVHPLPDTLPNNAQPKIDSGVSRGHMSFSSVENAVITTMNSMDVDDSNSHREEDLEPFSGLGDLSSSRDHEDSPSQARAGSSVSSLASADQGPRVLRLTEREIQEMAAIEEASIGNAPPSEREDILSEVGDLVSIDAPAHLMDPAAFSVQTHTTASVSNTSARLSGGQSHDEGVHEQHSLDGIETASVSSHLALSPGGSDGSVSVTVNPPSVVANEEPSSSMQDVMSPPVPPTVEAVIPVSHAPDMPSFDDDAPLLNAEESAIANAGVINRRIRPGMTLTPPSGRPKRATTPETNEMKRVLSMPEKMHVTVDGFDYDKYDFMPTTPRSNGDSMRELPGDELWGASESDGMMHVSPLQTSKRRLDVSEDGKSELSSKLKINYGSLKPPPLSHGQPNNISSDSYSDRDALIPREGKDGRGSMRSVAESVFSSIRSDSSQSIRAEGNESLMYKTSNIMQRAFPERFFALFVTLLVEIPVLLMISGGSDRLCMLIGRKRYQLLMGFLPLSSAISGNCGLQASTLTTRAISHAQVTVDNFRGWLRVEVGAALMLGLGMGTVLGLCAFMISEYDFAFGITIFVAQFVSVLTAGLTGTLAPLLFTFIFHQDSAKWGGPLETAIQDIVGSFAMVILSYRILLMFGENEIDPSDVCGTGGV